MARNSNPNRQVGRKRRGIGRLLLLLVLLAGAAAAIWWAVPYFSPRVGAPSAQLVLARTSFAQLPGWRESDARGALEAFHRSCGVWRREEPSHVLGGTGYAGTVGDWLGVCGAAPAGGASAFSARRFFESNFVPVAVAGDALFTGYYEPEIRVSRTRHGAYATPIYGLPDDLISADLGLFREELAGHRIVGRIQGHTLVPYFARADIDARGLAHAPVLLYAADPVQVFFLHIQGSGRARLEDGTLTRLAYAGQNGRPYTPVGRMLIAEGAIDRSQMSMQAIRAWMRTHGEDARRVMESDQSFVFFKEAPLGDPALGSPGSEGVALTPGASIAVDQHLHALGVPFYLATTAPDPDPSRPERPLNRIFIAQDTGGAIKGAARADLFWGFGANAESIAGRMKSGGSMFALLPKAVAGRLPGLASS